MQRSFGYKGFIKSVKSFSLHKKRGFLVMLNKTNYILSITFNYNSERNMIIETRCIKREVINSELKKEYLKAALKEYSADLYPAINKDLQNTRMLIFEKELTKEQIRLAMDKSFDLLVDIKKIFSSDDSNEILSKINLSPAI